MVSVDQLVLQVVADSKVQLELMVIQVDKVQLEQQVQME
jgi:hypothetical protein